MTNGVLGDIDRVFATATKQFARAGEQMVQVGEQMKRAYGLPIPTWWDLTPAQRAERAQKQLTFGRRAK